MAWRAAADAVGDARCDAVADAAVATLDAVLAPAGGEIESRAA